MVDHTQATAGSPWELRLGVDDALEDALTTRLVEHNSAESAAVRERFRPENLSSRPVAAYALGSDGALVGGCAATVEQVWHWLTVDTMWVHPSARGQGLGASLLGAVEDEARRLGCRWAKLNTFDFQAPGFYVACGYAEYAVEHEYPPGHANHLMRKDL